MRTLCDLALKSTQYNLYKNLKNGPFTVTMLPIIHSVELYFRVALAYSILQPHT